MYQREHSERYPALQVRTFTEITSAHGFGFFIASNSWVSKTAWAILTVAGVILSIFYTAKICYNSLQPPFFTTEIDRVSGVPLQMPLPDIVLCDPAPWDFKKAEGLNISSTMLSYISLLLFPLTGNNTVMRSKIQEDDQEYKEILTRFDNNPINLLNNITKNCSQLVRYCQFGPSQTMNGPGCCGKLFSNVEYTQNYKCYSSGNNINHIMWESTIPFGIAVTVRVQDESDKLNNNRTNVWALTMNGVGVGVANYKDNLFYVAQTNLHLLAPNTYNSIALERRETDSSDKDSAFTSYKGRIKIMTFSTV
jgi:Amiloride-sensitive sodium channel